VVLNNEGELYSFMGNSQQNGITPFSLNNVPVQVPGQALYLYNMESGALNSPTFLPLRRKDEPCDIIFGRGYAVYRKEAPGLDLEYTVFVLPEEPAEVRLLKIRNKSVLPQTLRVVPYLQIMLGETAADTRGKISAHYDESLQALFFANSQNDFYRGNAFAATSLPVEAYETVRSRFAGGTGVILRTPSWSSTAELIRCSLMTAIGSQVLPEPLPLPPALRRLWSWLRVRPKIWIKHARLSALTATGKQRRQL
jgi:cellobiose phosphorylase